jgi:hypothetical protein
MPTVKWNMLTEPPFTRNAEEITSPWMTVVDMLRDYTHLRIKAEGTWSQIGGLIGLCGPDGLPGLPLQIDRLAVADCPVGALIGKLSGSSASLSVPPTGNPAASGGSAPSGMTEGKAFAIGSYCVLALPQNFIGPLFVSFNGLTRPMRINDLKITIEGAVAA